MGLFNKKSAKQGELQAENAKLKEQLNKLTCENRELKAEKEKAEKAFAEKQSALLAEIYRLNKKIAKSEKFDSRPKDEKPRDRAAEHDGLAEKAIVACRDASENKNAESVCETSAQNCKIPEQNVLLGEKAEAELKTRYIYEINRLKTFIARWEKALCSGDVYGEKRKKTALTAAIKQIISFNEQECSLAELSQKVAEITDLIAGGASAENGGIDLDEVLNPSEDLDLETLCKELGVME